MSWITSSQRPHAQSVCMLALGLVALSASVYGVCRSSRAGSLESLPSATQSGDSARTDNSLESARLGVDTLAGSAANEVRSSAMTGMPVDRRVNSADTNLGDRDPTAAASDGCSSPTDLTQPDRPTALGQFNPGGQPGGSNRRGNNGPSGGRSQPGASRSGNNGSFSNGNMNGAGQGGVYIAPRIQLQSDSSGKLEQRRLAASGSRPQSNGFASN